MATLEFKIDMAELGDITQPLKVAHELHRQLRSQLGTVPLRLPLTQIAQNVGIVGIREFDTSDFEGTLVIKDGVGAIGLRRGLRTGRRNFTLAHEIGHFLIPNHRFQRGKFECKTADINKARERRGNLADRPQPERIEIEANEFAAAVLVPTPEYRTQRNKLGRACDLAHLRVLADAFAVSHEVMARIYVTNTDERAAIIISHDSIIRRIVAPGGFPYLGLRRGMPIPREAFMHRFKAAKVDTISELVEVPTHAWLDKRGDVSALYEQVLLQGEGWATTLLIVDEDDSEEEEDDRNWNRRSARR